MAFLVGFWGRSKGIPENYKSFVMVLQVLCNSFPKHLERSGMTAYRNLFQFSSRGNVSFLSPSLT